MPKSSYNTSRIDFEFYSRIRSLFTQMVCESNLSHTRKLEIAMEVSDRLRQLDLDESIIRQKSWKYRALLLLLKQNQLRASILFVVFDNNVNKQKLFFWKK